MTRDEAIELFNSVRNPASFSTEAWIDRFEALGILKFEKPPTPEMRLRTLLRELGHDLSVYHFEAIRNAGLRIVDAKGE